MRPDFVIPRMYDTERVAVIILRNMEAAFRNAANQIEGRSAEACADNGVQSQSSLVQPEVKKRPLIMTTQEACKALNMSKPKLYEIARSGKLRCIHVGKALRFSEQAIIDYIHLAEQESQPW